MTDSSQPQSLSFNELGVFVFAIVLFWLIPVIDTLGLFGGLGLLVIGWLVAVKGGTAGRRLLEALTLTSFGFLSLIMGIVLLRG